jgi:chromate reductase
VEPLSIVGIAGSLRRGSFNAGLLHVAAEVMPSGTRLETISIGALPLYDADLELDPPEPVGELRARIAAADALLIATPEYNYSVPGVLKNAIDWASRPPQTSPLRHKPVGIMGVSGGPSGTARAQLALRQVFVFTRSYVLPEPELLVREGRLRFDPNGNLVDDEVRERVRELVAALADWTRLVGGRQPGR